MSKGGFLGLIIFLALAGMLFWYISTIPTETSPLPPSNINTQIQSLTSGLTIASWNLQIFGQDKASDAALLAKYASIIGKYDVVFVQEIRDISETSFNKLCVLLPEYSCLISSRAGRSTSKEQIGLIYKKGVIVLDFLDYNSNADYQQYFERPPLKVIVQIGQTYEGTSVSKNLTIFNIHTKPDDVSNEMSYLEQIVKRDSDPNQPLIISGDLNYACDYRDTTKIFFNGYYWVIPDDADTTVGSTSCAYDRFISNFGVTEYGIDTSITSDLSDHYAIWIKI